MRLLLRTILWLLFLGPLLVGLLLWVGLSPTPLVPPQGPLSQQDMQRARSILQQHRRQGAEHCKALSLDARDLELAASLLLRRRLDGAVRAAIEDDRLRARAALRLPWVPLRPWLNLQLELREQAREPNLLRLRIGGLSVPQPVAKWLLARILAGLYQTPQYRLARTVVDDIRLQGGRLVLRYQWAPELAAQARHTLLDQHHDRDISAEQAYLEALRRLLRKQAPSRLDRLLPPLFALAAARSRNGDPTRENRALLTVLGAWAAPARATRLLDLPQVTGLPVFRIRLQGRIDLARHFLISAMLASRSNDVMANAAGEYKEVSDADGGTGFSFVDLMADRAGVRFGTLATASATSARALQRYMADGPDEAELMPSSSALREGLDLEHFQREYQGIGSPRYREMVETIDRRIRRSPLYRALP